MSGLQTTYTLYQIQTIVARTAGLFEPGEYRSLRRYSDFEQLHACLTAQEAIKFFVPDLPPKDYYMQSQKQITEERKKLLTMFLNDLLRRPQLAQQTCVRHFLTTERSMDEV
jgi:hypothetical protein